jgi:hypothetical protein
LQTIELTLTDDPRLFATQPSNNQVTGPQFTLGRKCGTAQ